jgi:hypothetical protein
VTESVRAVRASVQIGSLTVDGFMLPNGSYRMSQTQAAECVGLSERNASFFFNRIQYQHRQSADTQEIQSNSGKRGQSRIKAVSLEEAIDYWGYQASKGNLKAIMLLEAIGEHGIAHIPPKNIIVHFQKPGRKTAKESEYVEKLQSKLRGEREVLTPVGGIDLLTSTEIIEVKQVKQWKCAVGQVLVYSAYYPSHQKRIHLFGSCHESYLGLITNHCSVFGITVTWES